MTDQTDSGKRRGIFRGLLIAAVVAVVLLVTVVLPAERGWDPTGIGGRLGLTAMNEPAAAGKAASLDDVIEDVIGGNENLEPAETGGFSEPIPLPNPAIHQAETQPARTETFEITLPIDGKTEVKAVLQKSKAILYEWSVDGGQVYVDYHGHDPAKDDSFWVRYQEGDGVTGGRGSLVAPFAGEHGWYWLNVSDQPVTIRLTVTGFQDRMMDYGLLK